MTKNHQEIWQNCVTVIKDNLPEVTFNTWFKPIIPEKLEGNVLTINVPSQFFYEFLEEHYIDLLKKVLKKELGSNAKLKYSIILDNSNFTNSKVLYPGNIGVNLTNPSIKVPLKSNASINPDILPGIKKVHVDSYLNNYYCFENFIVGTCNNIAVAAGKMIGSKPGNNPYNPIFIWGKSGMGKTHLAQAIGIEVKENFGESKIVLYVSARRFEMQFTNAARKNTRNDFLHFYQMIDVLIIDDVHEFAGKPGTQDTFFHIFNHLHQSGKQLILTSDRAPSELKGLENRLISRFKWALTTELQAPDFETRVTILKKKAEKEGINISNEIINYIAENITGSIRELEGALISLLAHATLIKEDISFEFAKTKIDHLSRKPKKEITIKHIQKVVCDFYNMNIEAIQSKNRKREIVQTRQIAMYFAKKFTKYSLSTIGAEIGGKNHATVLYADKVIKDQLSYDKNLQSQIEDIEKRIETYK
ncbi:MAG: chromosomal replication initiator protein DnaA [Bacteroidales bacterium]|nr:chromosomal replication initiator protein DnaA [Bacteroidales bacterium]